jgi:iron complex transport system permease protein
MARKRRWTPALLFSCVSALLALALAVFAGSRPLDLQRAFHRLPPDYEILVSLRIPRALLALGSGGSLALAGLLFQALLRESLATPDTLGVTGGASLGAVLAICFGWNTVGGVSAIAGSAILGAVLVLGLVLLIASERGRISSFSLLLAGITVNSICSAAILFVSNFAGFVQSLSTTRWLIGSLDALPYSTLLGLIPVVAAAFALIFRHGREWNVLAVGETWAATRGLSPSRLLLIGYLAGSVLTGAVTSLTGPIGFVGLIVPHALRHWLGADHRILIPCSFLLGAALVAVCDVFSRTILAPVEIPVGVITALMGGPLFIWMLRSRKRSAVP